MKRGSVGWLVGATIAAHLQTMANAVATANIEDDGEFSIIISFAIKYWNVSAAKLAKNLRIGESQIHQWASGRVYGNHPSFVDRTRVLKWIEDDMRTRTNAIRDDLAMLTK